MDAAVSTRALCPALEDPEGWANFVGEVEGKNAFQKLSVKVEADAG
jgi:hypothetical protein